jgi:hypothetical protein
MAFGLIPAKVAKKSKMETIPSLVLKNAIMKVLLRCESWLKKGAISGRVVERSATTLKVHSGMKYRNSYPLTEIELEGATLALLTHRGFWEGMGR